MKRDKGSGVWYKRKQRVVLAAACAEERGETKGSKQIEEDNQKPSAV